jgi:hypothetical protein
MLHVFKGEILANMTQVSDVAPGPLVCCFFISFLSFFLFILFYTLIFKMYIIIFPSEIEGLKKFNSIYL